MYSKKERYRGYNQAALFEMCIRDRMMKEFVQTYEDIRMKTLLSGEYDRNNAIVSLPAGAGGTESCDLSLIHI